MTLRAVKNSDPVDRAKDALSRMGRADQDRFTAELDYGIALNEIKAQHTSDRAFGKAVKDAGLDSYEMPQLGTVQIKRDVRSACMWLAENEATARQMLEDGTKATSARGLHKAWKDAQRPTPAPTPPATPAPAPVDQDAVAKALEESLSASSKDRLAKAIETHKIKLDMAQQMTMHAMEQKHRQDIDKLAWDRVNQLLPGVMDRVEKTEAYRKRSGVFTKKQYKTLLATLHPDNFVGAKKDMAEASFKLFQDTNIPLVPELKRPVGMPTLEEIMAAERERESKRKVSKREQEAREMALDMLRKLYPQHYAE
ncbi:hypothetical protein [Ruegeria arenilitoris]|uniref:hypothetical protein n=1 Tax=Ruegeria arenilitoris TaxID=1173585 RepID=UPI003C7C5E62